MDLVGQTMGLSPWWFWVHYTAYLNTGQMRGAIDHIFQSRAAGQKCQTIRSVERLPVKRWRSPDEKVINYACFKPDCIAQRVLCGSPG
jgi:hypothetical protein